MAVATAAMISASALAAPQPKQGWTEVSGTATPTESFAMGKETRTLADFKGQVVVLNLWATWCTPCLQELPTLDALDEKYAADGLVVLPLSLDTIPFSQLQGFIAKQKLELPHLAQDSKSAMMHALKVSGVPTTFLIDRRGVIRAQLSGDADWTAPEQTRRIEALLAENETR